MKIEISKKTYDALAALATGFMTPEETIIKLLNHYHGESLEEITPIPVRKSANGKDLTKYVFQGQTYGKAKLVHAIVKEYVLDNPTVTFEELEDVFPSDYQGSLSVFMKFEEAKAEYKDAKVKRYYIATGMEIQLVDQTIAVCNQWGTSNIDNMLEAAESLNYQVSIKGITEEKIEADERQCRICGEWKSIVAQFNYTDTKRRLQWCTECNTQYQQKRTNGEDTDVWIKEMHSRWDYGFRKVNKDR